MESIPYEDFFQIMVRLPFNSIIDFCQTNPEYYQICLNNDFWSAKAQYDLDITADQFNFNRANMSPIGRYIELLAKYGKTCLKGSEKFVDINYCLYLASERGDRTLIDYFINKGANVQIQTLIGAIRGGNIKITDYILSLLKNNNLFNENVLSMVLMEASKLNNESLEDYLINIYNDFINDSYRSIYRK